MSCLVFKQCSKVDFEDIRPKPKDCKHPCCFSSWCIVMQASLTGAGFVKFVIPISQFNDFLYFREKFADSCCLHSTKLNKLCWLLQRKTAAQIYRNEWFKNGYTPSKFSEEKDVNLDDIDAVFNESTVRYPLSTCLLTYHIKKKFMLWLWHHSSWFLV